MHYSIRYSRRGCSIIIWNKAVLNRVKSYFITCTCDKHPMANTIMFYEVMIEVGAKRVLLINSSLSSYAKRKSAKRKVFATCSFLFRFLRNKEMVLCILLFKSDLLTLRV